MEGKVDEIDKPHREFSRNVATSDVLHDCILDDRFFLVIAWVIYARVLSKVTSKIIVSIRSLLDFYLGVVFKERRNISQWCSY